MLSRDSGAYNSKFLFSDEYVFGNAQIANCCVRTPVSPTGATDGLTHVFPAVLDLQGPSKVDAIRYIASVVNAASSLTVRAMRFLSGGSDAGRKWWQNSSTRSP